MAPVFPTIIRRCNMAFHFSPSGILDINTDPSELPETGNDAGTEVYSGAMTRCKNLRLDQKGVAITRRGSSNRGNNVNVTGPVYRAIELAGRIYEFLPDGIYTAKVTADLNSGEENPTLRSSLTSTSKWSAITYNAYNSTTVNVFALNGTDRKRIYGTTVKDWGIAPPTYAPILSAGSTNGWSYMAYTSGGTVEIVAGNVITGDDSGATGTVQEVTLTSGSWAAGTAAGVIYVNGVSGTFEDETVSVGTHDDLATVVGTEMTTQDAMLTGNYNVKYTYCRKEDEVVVCESNPSPAAGSAVPLVNQSLNILFDASTDSQVTHVRVYRTEAGGSVYYHDQDVAIGTTTAESTQSDGALGSLVATDHDRPPATGTLIFGPDYNGYCFIADGNKLYYCLPKQPEYWPALYYVEVGSPQFPIIAGGFYNGAPYVATQRQIYQISGTGANTFFPVPMSAQTGTKSQDCFEPVLGKGIFHLGADGIYVFSGSGDKKLSDATLWPIFQGTDTNGIPGLNLDELDNCWMISYKGRLYFAYPSTTATYPDSLLVLDLETGQQGYYDYGWLLYTACIDHTYDKLVVGATDSRLYYIEETDSTMDTTESTSGVTSAISWELQSKAYTLQTRKHFPRWVKYDVNAATATTCTGALLLDDVVHQSHTINTNRQTRRRLVVTGTGDRAAVRITGSGPVSIYAVEFE